MNRCRFLAIAGVVLAGVLATAPPCRGLILVVRGNQAVERMGWPLGCEKVANLGSRLGYWEGPPFGGGEYHFLYNAKDTAEFNEALKAFAAIQLPRIVPQSATSKDLEVTYRADARPLELIVLDGPEHYTWHSRVGGLAVEEKLRIDWSFVVWSPASWHRLYNNPKSAFASDHPNFRQPVPPPQIEVYVGGGGSIVWKDVKLPANVRLIDRRAESAPVKPVGGGLVRCAVYDMATAQPIPDAEITLLRREDPRTWKEVARGEADENGQGEIQKVPAGYYHVRIRAKGYAPRSRGPYQNKGNTYQEFVVLLTREASVKGLVTDPNGAPIPGVQVSAEDTMGIDGLGYPCADAKPATTDKEGRFELRGLPQGVARVSCRAPSLHQETPILQLYDVPTDEVKIVMQGTGIVRGKVVGRDEKTPPGEVHVNIEPPGGGRVGQWGGSMRCKEDGAFEFKGVPPGQYVLSTNPMHAREGGDANAKSVTVTAGQTVEVELKHHRSR